MIRGIDAPGSGHEGNAYRIDGDAQRFSGAFSGDGQVLSGQWMQRVGDGWIPFIHVALRKRARSS